MKTDIWGIVSFLFKISLEEKFEEIKTLTSSDANIIFAASKMKKSLNAKIENAKTFDDLPDMLIRSDYRGLFDKTIKTALKIGIFENVIPSQYSSSQTIYPKIDELNGITLLGAKQWVIVIDRGVDNKIETPKHWGDLLDKKYENKIGIQGEEGRYCGVLLLYIHKEFGVEGLKSLAKNIKSVSHFTNMIKSLGKKNPSAAPINIMPLTNANMIVNDEDIEIIWPEEGALATPIYTLIKKEKAKELNNYIEYLISEDFQNLLKQNHMYSVMQKAENKKLNWLGWDYIFETKVNLEDHKEFLNEIFKNSLTI